MKDPVDGNIEDQPCDGCRGGGPFDKQPKDKGRQNPRGNISLKILDVVEYSLKLRIAQLGGYQTSDEDKDNGHDPSEENQCLR